MRSVIVVCSMLALMLSCKSAQQPFSVPVSSDVLKPVLNPYYWQQRVNYKMDIDMDVSTYRYKGTQTLEYTNNSPDTLKQVFYHLYFNLTIMFNIQR